ncbi:MAG: ribbon-helix-helix protein, CopG family [Candidatus Thorarchaeota archaeon]|nr:ribbon-helix-helix protein, CopG family [Candidatus Thorarchaeota archaeon]
MSRSGDKSSSEEPTDKRHKRGRKAMSGSSQDKKKIISVTMSQSVVSQIDRLVEDRAARSRAQLIEDAVRYFIDFTVHKWNDRGIYVNNCRVVMESDTQSSLFFSTMTPASQYEMGRTAGSQSPIADVIRLVHGKNPADPSSRQLVMRLLQAHGWGAMNMSEDGLVVVGSPFYPAQFVRGYLEALMKVQLELVETHAKDNIALRVVR